MTQRGEALEEARQAAKIIRVLGQAIVDTIEEVGTAGSPSGVVYMALQTYGVSLGLYQSLIEALVKAGRITQRGDLLYPAGRAS